MPSTEKTVHHAVGRLAQVVQDFINNLPPSAKIAVGNQGQQDINDIQAMLDHRESLMAKLEAIEMEQWKPQAITVEKA